MNTLRLSPAVLEVGLRWTARLLALFVVGVVLAIFIGTGGFNPLKLTPVETALMVFFITICVGMVAAWRWALIGGAISVSGFLLFLVVEFAARGRFQIGGFFYLMLLPGILFMLVGLLRKQMAG